MSYYEKHVFICTNQRDGNRACCANGGSEALWEYAKSRVKSLGLAGKGKLRINKSGCLDRCEEGPVLVVYPEGVWYGYHSKADVDEIIDQHLVKGKIVERLRLKTAGE